MCTELQRRGHHAVHGDRELSYQGDPVTGAPTDTSTHEHHIWDVDRVRALASDRTAPVHFFCGGSRNHARFIELFDRVFVLVVDRETLLRRLAERTDGEWGVTADERDLVLRLHRTGEDVPQGGIAIDATRPIGAVVDEIVRRALHPARAPHGADIE